MASLRYVGTLIAALALTGISLTGSASAETKSAIFAGGCFWCVEEAFDKIEGVTETISGYIGGSVDDPTYKQVSAGGTGHFEAVEVEYDPAKVTYAQLLDTFWHNIDPFDARGQFCDKGSQYFSAIFVADAEQQALAEKSKEAVVSKFDKDIATQILPAATFYPAEDYHQNFHVTNEARYKYYKFGCGRAQRLQEIWGDPAA
jgi:peptide-methionine (S)-S-oxide reductase